MRVSIAPEDTHLVPADALAIPIVTGSPQFDSALVDLDRHLDGLIHDVVAAGEHRGRLHEVLPLPTGGRIAARRLLLYGLGSEADLDRQRLAFAHHEMIRAARTYGYQRLAVLRTRPLRDDSLGPIVEGCVMGTWESRIRQTGPSSAQLLELALAGFGPGLEQEVADAAQLGEAANGARELVATPPNELTPEGLAAAARRIAHRHGLEIEVLGPAELQEGGYNLLLGVGAGSDLPPRLIRLRHRGSGEAPRLALIGKGITFDTGGISIKPAKNMDKMKGDMAGAAAVLHAIDVIAARRLPIDVMAIVATAENMTSGAAQRPGDVVTSANGKTVEILNTDAEGRLVLADAITHAVRHDATHIVDFATLTGAATTALGHAATAAIANDEEFWATLAQAAERSGERVWRFPIYPDYRLLLRSRTADLRNADYGEAGMILAGMFLGEFVEGRPWAHFDIAASSWNTNSELLSVPRGPLGTGTRLSVRLAELMASTHR